MSRSTLAITNSWQSDKGLCSSQSRSLQTLWLGRERNPALAFPLSLPSQGLQGSRLRATEASVGLPAVLDSEGASGHQLRADQRTTRQG